MLNANHRNNLKGGRSCSVDKPTVIAVAFAFLLAFATPSAPRAQDTPWLPVGPFSATVFSFERDPATPEIFYVGTFSGGLYRCINDGAACDHQASGFSDDTVFGIAVDNADPAILYVATFRNRIYKSVDGGGQWLPASNGFTPITAQDVAVDPNDGNVVLASSDVGVFRSVDAGANWVQVNGPLENTAVRDLLFVTDTPGLVYAGTSGLGVFKSSDSGQTWTEDNTGLGQKNVTALTYDAATQKLLAATSLGAFERVDGSPTWNDLSFNLVGQKFNYLMPRPGGSVIGATDNGTYELTGSPMSWVLWSDAKTRLLNTNPASGRIHLASIFGSFLYTDDDGATFAEGANGIQNRFVGAIETIDFGGTPLIYAGTDFGVEAAAERYREDPAPPWFSKFPFPGALFDLVAHPSVDGRMYAGSERGGVWRSDYWGLFWEPSSNGIVPARIEALAQAPTAANPLYAGTSSGVFVSYDNGLNWVARNISDTAPQVTAVDADPALPGHAYAGSNDGRIFRTITFGDSFFPTWQEPDGDAIVEIKASRFFNIYAVSSAGKLYSSDDIGLNFFRRAETVSEPIQTVAVDPVEPWVAYVGTLFGGVYKTESNAINWEQKSIGIDVPFIFSLIVDPTNTATVYAGAVGKIYRTVDAGESWVALTGALPYGIVSQLALDESTGALYASIDGFGIYSSGDGGVSWVQALSGAGVEGRSPLLMSEVDPSVLFAGTLGTGISRSADAGSTWAPSNTGLDLFVRSIAIDPVNTDTMYATSIGAGVFKSADGGLSWEPKGVDDGNLFNVAIDIQTPSTIYVGTAEGVSVSTDSGDSWDNLAFRAPFIFDSFTDPSNPADLYAVGASAKVYKSDSGGKNWTVLPRNGLPTDNLLSGAINPVSGALYVGSENFGVFKLDAGKRNWESLGPGNLPIETKITDIVIPEQGGVIYIATTGAGFYGSLDGGENWIPLSAGIPSIEGAVLKVDPFDGGRLFAGVYNDDPAAAGLFRSINGGISWTPTSFAGSSATVIGMSPHSAGLMFAAGPAGLEKSTNGGATWTAVPMSFGNITSLGFDATLADVVYVGNASGVLYTSNDNGQSWSNSAIPVPAAIMNITPSANPGEFFVATLGDGLLATNTGGSTWVYGHARGLWDVPVLFLAQNPLNADILYAATGGKGMLKSIDGGVHWDQINNGLDTDFLLTLALDEQNPDTLYVGTAGLGVYISEDGGANWRPFNMNLFNKTVTSLDILHLDSTVIYVGTEGGGLFKNPR